MNGEFYIVDQGDARGAGDAKPMVCTTETAAQQMAVALALSNLGCVVDVCEQIKKLAGLGLYAKALHIYNDTFRVTCNFIRITKVRLVTPSRAQAELTTAIRRS